MTPSPDLFALGGLGVTFTVGVAQRFSWTAGTIAAAGVLGELGEIVMRRAGLFAGVSLRSSLAVTIDVVWRVNGAPTTAAGVALPGGGTVVPVVFPSVPFAAGDLLSIDVVLVAPALATIDLTGSVELLYT